MTRKEAEVAGLQKDVDTCVGGIRNCLATGDMRYIMTWARCSWARARSLAKRTWTKEEYAWLKQYLREASDERRQANRRRIH